MHDTDHLLYHYKRLWCYWWSIDHEIPGLQSKQGQALAHPTPMIVDFSSQSISGNTASNDADLRAAALKYKAVTSSNGRRSAAAVSRSLSNKSSTDVSTIADDQALAASNLTTSLQHLDQLIAYFEHPTHELPPISRMHLTCVFVTDHV